MIRQESRLVTFVKRVEHISLPESPKLRKPGHPLVYVQCIILKSVVVVVVPHLTTVHELLGIGRTCRRVASGSVASKTSPSTCQPPSGAWDACWSQSCSLGSSMGKQPLLTVRRSRPAGVWHRRLRERGEVPCGSIHQEAQWTKSGWHALVYSWEPPQATAVGPLWQPLTAEVTVSQCG